MVVSYSAFAALGWLLITSISTRAYRLGLAVKSADIAFFQLAEKGCLDRASEGNHSCVYGGPTRLTNNTSTDPDGTVQVKLLREMLDTVDGVAVSVRNASAIAPVFDEAKRRGIPVITFDSDAPQSSRISYIGTDNHFLGVTLAKVAKQISPEGGTYGVLLSDHSPNLLERLRGFREEIELENSIKRILWKEVEEPLVAFNKDADVAVQKMQELADINTTVICGLDGGPMWSDLYEGFYNQNKHRNMTIVVADDHPRQLDFLSRGKAQGLVGQMPYEMGFRSADLLIKLLDGQKGFPEKMGTNLITHLQVPLVLPELSVDTNLIGNFFIIGYSLFGIVTLGTTAAIAWTIHLRKRHVVQAAQPPFLIMVAFGILMMGAIMIPLSLDDNGDSESISPLTGKLYCMSIPWLSFCGFTITFSALFSKLIRVNRIVHASGRLVRIGVKAEDVVGPAVILLTLNIALLALWSAMDPLTYVRQSNPGTDGWNRIISTFGACRSQNVSRFLIPLTLVNAGVLVLANYQAFVARRIKSEFAESKYIAAAMVSLLQAMMTGVPILFVVKDSPQAFYLVMVFMTFAICMGLLVMIFIPKVMLAKQSMMRTDASQRRMIGLAIRESIQRVGSAREDDMQRSYRSRRPSTIPEEKGSTTLEADDTSTNNV